VSTIILHKDKKKDIYVYIIGLQELCQDCNTMN